ncbi:SDR family NAD(P)-dependent oxidoreductase [Cupriavidus pauculus]|uniref:SDR family NAD(P)-dependent oxidoreductase n=1 Tax=Cupriavidus pauculus TaxID=82633 RepID=UPI0012467473|nr:glucose 1-dehydrogenase [Cupriavidus pauculus]KAB0603490.1 glucose 1-dehydrogenase [Cupriavidus pauculus]MCM3605786.1 glucose 1-dehydrogenase [Cupriavidus pauculus]UAL02251.1 glucose 1-dehydrogenase [Cupriavidus pauculus]
MRLQDRTALVTGGAGGIGQAIALRLAQEGADVVIAVHRHDAKADEIADAVRAAGRRAFVVAADIGNVAQAGALIDEGSRLAGRLDILVNNAGVEIRAPFTEVTETDYDRVLDTNLKGPFFLTQFFVRHLQARQCGGKIINISSVHEELPFPHFTSYCASKGGLRMMMRNLAIELAPLGITVNNIAPGAIETPINRNLMADRAQLQALIDDIPLARLGRPAEVAGLVAYLASAEADYITGATLVIDGGLLWNYAEQ